MLELSNPLSVMTFWTRATVAVAEAGLSTTLGTMASCCEQFADALESTAGHRGDTRTAEAAAQPVALDDAPASPFSNVLRLWSGDTSSADVTVRSTRASTPKAREEEARSWYRAPYRSPFDPAFWLTPGADWDPLMQLMGPFHPFAMRPSPNHPLAPFPSAMSMAALFPMLAPRQAAPPMSFPFALGGYQPLLPWLPVNWLELYAHALRIPNLPAPANDPAPPRATYRTDGGHAASMVTWLPATTAKPRDASPDEYPGQNSRANVDWPFLLVPWFPR
jgi:hypothetical protein